MVPWSAIAECLTVKFGLAPQPAWSEDIDRALAAVAKDAGLAAYDAADRALRDAVLLRSLAGRLTIDETHFFRHAEQFEILVRHVQRRLSEGRGVNICSIGCAHGEEPYSIIIALWERLSLADLDRVSLIASDLNPDAIARAASGVFRSWSGRGLSPERRQRCFLRLPNGDFQISEILRSRVQFRALSANEHAMELLPASVDAIFFRNVAIYLEPQVLQQLYARFATALREDGLLFTAPVDPGPHRELLALDDPDVFSVYRKIQWSQSITEAVPASSIRIASVPRPAGASLPDAAPRTTLEAVRAQADRGDLAGALSMAAALPKSGGTAIPTRLLRGQIYLAADEPERGVSDLAQAVFDDPADLVARFWYAVVLLRSGAPRRALFQINALIERLSAIDRGAVLPDGTTQAADLLAAALEIREQIT